MYRLLSSSSSSSFVRLCSIRDRTKVSYLGRCCFSSEKDSSDPQSEQSSSALSDEWIPPSRPLSGDQGNSKLYKQHGEIHKTEQALEDAIFVIDESDSDEDVLRRLDEALALEEELERQQFEQALADEQDSQNESVDSSFDWLATRRAALGDNPDGQESVVAVIEKELLTKDELTILLESLGGTDIVCLEDDLEQTRMGGADGMLLCTASSVHHIRTMSKALVDHLKARKLNEVGVLGAEIGSRSFKNSTSTWNVVDCSNFIVHIFDNTTRMAVNLEDLWSGKDPIWKLDITNEDAVDDYVAKNPVPFTYGPSPDTFWDVNKLERNRFAPHSPVISSDQKRADRQSGRRKRREMRQNSLA